MEITDSQIWDMGDTFSANFAIDDRWLIQLGDDGRFAIPRGEEAFWSTEEAQDAACEEFDAAEVADLLEIPDSKEAIRAMGAKDMLDD